MRAVLVLSCAAVALAAALVLGPGAEAQGGPAGESATEARAALRIALAERRAAEQRSRTLEREAQGARDAADRAAREAAALAARVQQAEAGIAAAGARQALALRERAILLERLGAEQRPLTHLTAALQQLSRRPVSLSVLRPGSVRDVVYLRAMLDGALPRVRQRTAGLRGQLADGRRLREEALAAASALRAEEARLQERRRELAALEQRQRLTLREASGASSREQARALALGEQARDLDSLVAELDRAGSLRVRLASLPGPLLRPERPEDARAASAPAPSPLLSATAPPSPYLLPVTGRTAAGFGARGAQGVSNGVTLIPRPGAQVVAPAAGRVAFAGAYRGFGMIVIVEHAGGWISLVTGLARADAVVGQQLVAGAPLGVAPEADPAVTLELRQDGVAVNPLRFIG